MTSTLIVRPKLDRAARIPWAQWRHYEKPEGDDAEQSAPEEEHADWIIGSDTSFLMRIAIGR
jgi:hypothetical protein